MSAVLYDLAGKRNEKLVSVLRGLLEHAESGELVDFGGEVGDTRGRRFVVRCGAYESDGALSDMGFRLQVKAAFKVRPG